MIHLILKTFEKYNHLTNVLPAMGYGKKQIKELEETINNTDCEIVISGTPIDITRVLKPSKPIVRIRYSVGKQTEEDLERIVDFNKLFIELIPLSRLEHFCIIGLRKLRIKVISY